MHDRLKVWYVAHVPGRIYTDFLCLFFSDRSKLPSFEESQIILLSVVLGKKGFSAAELYELNFFRIV